MWAVQWPLIRAFAARAGVKAKRIRGGDAPSYSGRRFAGVGGRIEKRWQPRQLYGPRTTRGGWYEEVNKCNQEII